MQPKPKIHPAVAAIIIIVLVGIVTSVVVAVNSANTDKSDTSTAQTAETTTPSQQSETTTTQNTETPAASTDTSNYENGTYSAKASYVTPGGIESIDLSVTITNGVITDTSVAASGNSDHAQIHQKDFADGYKSLVVGKDVDSVSLSRVSGASLTSNAFNDALDMIKQDATA